MEPESFFRS